GVHPGDERAHLVLGRHKPGPDAGRVVLVEPPVQPDAQELDGAGVRRLRLFVESPPALHLAAGGCTFTPPFLPPPAATLAQPPRSATVGSDVQQLRHDWSGLAAWQRPHDLVVLLGTVDGVPD